MAYDPLTLLERANEGSTRWLAQMDAARARQNESYNRAISDGIIRDRVTQLYPADLYQSAATALYGGDQARMLSRLIPEQERNQRSAYRLDSARNLTGQQEQQWAWTPENTAARRTLVNDSYQSPAAALQVAAETYGIVDPVALSQQTSNTLTRYPGALAARASASPAYNAMTYGTVVDSLLTGQTETANAFLRANRLGSLEPQSDGRFVLRDPYGNASAPMAASEVGMVLQSRLGQPATQLQGYAGAQQQAAQSAVLERIKQEAALARDDREALNKVRIKLLELQGDPMSTPETRTATIQAARELGFDIGGGAAGIDPGLSALGLSSGGATANAELITGAPRRPPIPSGTAPATTGAAAVPASTTPTVRQVRQAREARETMQRAEREVGQAQAAVAQTQRFLQLRQSNPPQASNPFANLQMRPEDMGLSQQQTQLEQAQARLRAAQEAYEATQPRYQPSVTYTLGQGLLNPTPVPYRPQ